MEGVYSRDGSDGVGWQGVFTVSNGRLEGKLVFLPAEETRWQNQVEGRRCLDWGTNASPGVLLISL